MKTACSPFTVVTGNASLTASEEEKRTENE